MYRLAFALVVAVATGLISQASRAADLPLKAPALVPGYNWSGIYIGGNVGYGRSTTFWDNLDDTTLWGDNIPPDSFSHGVSGMIGGGQIGYNYQTGPYVFGIEAMIDASAIKGDHASDTVFGAADDQFETRIKTLVLITGRIGYAWNNLLVYGKGGLAMANIHLSVTDDTGPFTGSGSASKWRTGLTFGAGLEYGITPNLSVGIEYDYIRLQSAQYELGDDTGTYLWDVDLRNVSLLMAKLNYRLDWLR